LQNYEASKSQKGGPFALGTIYELTQGNNTRYVVSMENSRDAMTLTIDGSGNPAIQHKERKVMTPEAIETKDFIAKKNK
jgi:hypothetical protein